MFRVYCVHVWRGIVFLSKRYSTAITAGDYTSWGSDLCYQDFWPTCTNPDEPDLRLVYFESFE